MREITKDQKTALELMIDGASTAVLLAAVSEICNEKAEHVRTNWQDTGLAGVWEQAARKIDTCASTGAVQRISV